MSVAPDRYSSAPRVLTLGDGFFDVVAPAAFPTHQLRYRNQRAAARVGLDTLDAGEWERHFAAFAPLPDNLASPLALRYHGHQFMTYNPALGDGRGFLFAQLLDADDGRLLDLGTKGSGQTPYSRAGDGRLTLLGGLREVLATEMLEALGVDTSKSFSLFETGESLYRSDEQSPTRASVLVRLSHSHIRFGSFQRHAAEGNVERVQRLLDYTAEHYMPDLCDRSGAARVAAVFARICEHTAALAASWTAAGFVHGVLNTDNMNVTGESFDYGPYRFLPTLDPDFVAAYFDASGLYAFGRQPTMLAWNLEQLAHALTLVCEEGALQDGLRAFKPAFEQALRTKLLARLGVAPREPEWDQILIEHVQAFLTESQIGYERFFFDWYGGLARASTAAVSPDAAAYQRPSFTRVRAHLEGYVPAHPARLSHPYFQQPSPCTLLIEEIEALWSAIAWRDDWSVFEAKLTEIATMRTALQGGAT